MEIPQGHQTIMPYLMLNGAARFIDFTREVFGSRLTFSAPRDESNAIMHAEININGSTIMFTEATDQWKVATAHLFVYVEDVDTTFQKAIASGASVLLEIEDKEYGRSGGITDPFGNTWWITSVK